MRRRPLSRRLVLLTVAVVAVAAVAAFVTARFLGPELFDTEVRQIGRRYGWDGAVTAPGGGSGSGGGGRGSGAAALEAELGEAFTSSLTLALFVALGVGGAAALAVGAVVARRIVRPIQRMRSAVRRMAGGRYDERIPEPPDLELADLAADINALGSALGTTEERRARLVSDLSHEIRTPITSLEGFLEGLEDGVFEPDPKTLAAMRSETRRLSRLAADLGAVSRASEDVFDLRRKDADLGEIAAGAARAVAATFSAREVGLEVVPMPELPVRVDADRMAQVFSNLLRNALQHTDPGGMVTITGVAGDDRATVAVADTGRGISPEDLERVFDRFVKVGGVAAKGGSGIGLTIARGIARAHGGEIVAASRGPGLGSVFTVTVPFRR